MVASSANAGPCSVTDFVSKVFQKPADRYLGHVKEWNVPDALISEIAQIWEKAELTETAKMGQTYEILMNHRLANTNWFTRSLTRRSIEKAMQGKGIYQNTLGKFIGRIGGPHYTPLFNRVFIPESSQGTAHLFMLAIHEGEHAFQRNSVPVSNLALFGARTKELFMVIPTPVSPLAVFEMESRALGAQWELARAIPLEHRKKLIAEVKELNRLNNIRLESLKNEISKNSKGESNLLREEMAAETLSEYDNLLVQSLLKAHLPKQEFIKAIRKVHGYTLRDIMQNHYSWGMMKTFRMSVPLYGFYLGVQAYRNQDRPALEKEIQQMPSFDLRIFLDILSIVMSEPPAGEPKPK